ncbi:MULTISPECIES: PAS domain S-box protein [Pseudomonas]|jgi:PAS domain S-box-containing protein|uniref:PAS domain S-box protein n=1 Tax=Pseudomonas TaxID=286 RepID=UPI000C1134D3|nr:PAS domain-containing sensor histidine kinase [Pseudomonadaceae bacterium]HCP55420.1 PAS domain-containing sensor histidine kinase [Pseudomonas sp.]
MFTPGSADFQTLLETMPMCTILHDAKTKDILWANTAALTVLGFTLEELVPLKAPDMSGPRYPRADGLRWLEGAVKSGQQVTEWGYRSKQGVEILCEAVATLVHLNQRDVLMVQFRDISREEQVKRDLRRFESRLNAFMQDLAEGVAVLDAQGNIQFISDSGQRLLGDANAMQVGDCFVAACDEDSRLRLLQNLKDAQQSREPYSVKYRIQHSDKSWHWHHATCRQIDIEDDLSGHLLLFRDVTEQVNIEEARRLSERKLEYLARHNAMGEMALAIAHELSQPLAATRNFIEGTLMRLNQLDPTQSSAAWGLDNAVRQIEHASVIIKSVREYVVKLDQAEQVADLNEILAETQYFISLRAQPSAIDIEFAPCQERLLISCERVLIGQVILNLAFNAIEELAGLPQHQRKLRLYTYSHEGKVMLCVEDQGRGIGAGQQEKLFDEFFSTKVSGNGIGLALCKSIIARHRGDIWAQNISPSGAMFCFTLPRLCENA